MVLENINLDKNNLTIILLVIGLIFIFHLYWKLPTRECMANLDDTQKSEVKQLIYDTYKIDVNSIKNLSRIADDLVKSGISVPGNLNIKGSLAANDNITHPDSGNSIYKADEFLTIAAKDFIKFRSSTNKISNIEMDVNAGNVKSKSMNVTDKLTSNAIDATNINSTQLTSTSINTGLLTASRSTNDGGGVTLQNPLKNDKPGQMNQWTITNTTGDLTGNKLMFTGRNNNNTSTGSTLEILDSGLVNIASSLYVKKNNYLFYPEDAVIYNNIMEALTNGIVKKNGNPIGWDESSYKTNPWNNRLILRIGGKNTYPNGILVTVPPGKNVIWVRVLNERWNCFQVYNDAGVLIWIYTGGRRNLNNLAPDGGCPDVTHRLHKWMFMPVPSAGNYIICSGNNVNDGGDDGWISGIAFSSNPWNWVMNPILAYHWKLNGTTATIPWHSDDWNSDNLAYFPAGSTNTIIVPVIRTGKDKLLYFIEHNNVQNSCSIVSITVNNVQVERLRATWDHPLARFTATKPYGLFYAARIPKELMANVTKDNITVTINMSLTVPDNHFYVREIGTIDLY